eukprot:1381680-Karenia_brevis.AAC.1
MEKRSFITGDFHFEDKDSIIHDNELAILTSGFSFPPPSHPNHLRSPPPTHPTGGKPNIWDYLTTK